MIKNVDEIFGIIENHSQIYHIIGAKQPKHLRLQNFATGSSGQ